MLRNNGKKKKKHQQRVIHFFCAEELPKQKQQPFRVWIWESLQSASDLTSQNNEPPHKESANCELSVHLNFLQLEKKGKQEIPLEMPAGLLRVTGSSEGFQMA